MKSKHHYNTSLKCILNKYCSLILPRTATSGSTVSLVVPFTKPNVFRIRCQILCFVKKFAPHVDHFMQNETAQIVHYI